MHSFANEEVVLPKLLRMLARGWHVLQAEKISGLQGIGTQAIGLLRGVTIGGRWHAATARAGKCTKSQLQKNVLNFWAVKGCPNATVRHESEACISENRGTDQLHWHP